MKRKELMNFAKQIAQAERTIRDSDDPKEIKQAQDEIMQICSHIHNFEDMALVDEMVQTLLSSN